MATDDQIDKLIESLTNANASQADVLKKLLGGSKDIDKMSKVILTMTKNTDDLNKAVSDAARTMNMDSRQEAALRKKVLSDSLGSSSKLNNAFEKVSGSAKAASAGIGSVFAGLLAGSDKLKMSSVLQSALSPLVALAPKIFGPLSTAVGFVVGYIEQTFDSWQRLSASGYSAGSTLGDLQKAAAAAGMSMEQFEFFIKNNSEAMANFGNMMGGVGDGVDKFTAVFGDMLTPLGKYNTELRKLGYSQAELQSVSGSLAETMVATGEAQSRSQGELSQAAVNALRDIDTLARLTGKSREQIAKDMAAAAKASPNWQAFLQTLSPDRRGKVQAFLQSLPEELRQAALSSIATGGKIVTEDMIPLVQNGMTDTVRMIQQFGQQVAAGGDLSLQNSQDLQRQLKADGEKNSALRDTFIVAANAGVRDFDKNLKLFAEAGAVSIKDLDKVRRSSGGAIDPMIRFQQTVDSLSQTFRSIFLPLVEKSLLPMFEKLSTAMDSAKDSMAGLKPKLEEFFDGLGTRLGMLFDENGRRAVFGEISGFLKGLLADLVDAMSESFLGRHLLGASKEKAENLRIESRIANLEMQKEQAGRGSDTARVAELQAEIDALRAKLPQSLPMLPSVTEENIPGASIGGVFSAPRTGGLALLHGREAVVPLPNGRSIPIELSDKTSVSAGNAVNNTILGGATGDSSRELLNQMLTLNSAVGRLLAINEQQYNVLDRQHRLLRDANSIS